MLLPLFLFQLEDGLKQIPTLFLGKQELSIYYGHNYSKVKNSKEKELEETSLNSETNLI